MVVATETKAWFIYCDCHEGRSKELLAILEDGKLKIRKKGHEIAIEIDRIQEMRLILE